MEDVVEFVGGVGVVKSGGMQPSMATVGGGDGNRHFGNVPQKLTNNTNDSNAFFKRGKGTTTSSNGKAIGRHGKQKRLKDLIYDNKLSKSDRGWLKQENNQIKRKKRNNLRVPPGKELAHQRGFEASKGYGYDKSNLQDKDLHKLQHKYDKKGKLNKDMGQE